MLVREKSSGEEYSLPLEMLVETDWRPSRNLAHRHTGGWNFVRPGGDSEYEFTPENDEERQMLQEYGFTITDLKKHEQATGHRHPQAKRDNRVPTVHIP